jgi:hypothetical protein
MARAQEDAALEARILLAPAVTAAAARALAATWAAWLAAETTG